MKGFGGGMQNLMRQANQMQNKIKKLQDELATREFAGSAGGGAVQVLVTGDHLIASVTIKPEVLSQGDAEMLQDLVKVAVNEAVKLAKTTSQEEMAKITGGMGSLAGMF
jgi:DNA-binding YbaB/EbfC family protein